jgi:hypothetical protein
MRLDDLGAADTGKKSEISVLIWSKDSCILLGDRSYPDPLYRPLHHSALPPCLH